MLEILLEVRLSRSGRVTSSEFSLLGIFLLPLKALAEEEREVEEEKEEDEEEEEEAEEEDDDDDEFGL